MYKKLLFILLIYSSSLSVLLAQNFTEADLNYWDFPLNAVGYSNGSYYWLASDNYEENWYKFSFNDNNWTTPVESNFTIYPPWVWSSDPAQVEPNAVAYFRGLFSFSPWHMGKVTKVKIMIFANDDYQLFFNENLIDEDKSGRAGPTMVYDVTDKYIENGNNLIAIKATNYFILGYVQFLLRVYFENPTNISNTNIHKGESSKLIQNYPNPFNPETIIEYDIPKSEVVVLTIFNSLGQKVKTLVHQFQQPRHYKIKWDGKNDQGEPLPSGAYFYHLKIGNEVQNKKMILLR